MFWGSKITADGDCSHDIKRRLLLGRKVMTNLDSILKSRDITLPTKVRLVNAMVLRVVMYSCESWTVKKAECQKNVLVIANTLFQQHKRIFYTWTSPDGQYQNPTDYILCSQRWRSSIQSAKTRS